jgi:hypothetical protein
VLAPPETIPVDVRTNPVTDTRVLGGICERGKGPVTEFVCHESVLALKMAALGQ